MMNVKTIKNLEMDWKVRLQNKILKGKHWTWKIWYTKITKQKCLASKYGENETF